MKLARLVTALFLLLVGAAPANAATGEAEDWFADSAVSVVRSHAAESLPELTTDQLANLTVGDPVRAATFSGTEGEYEESNIWVAPISVDDAVVGTVASRFVSGSSEQVEITADTSFGEAITAVPEDSQVVIEPAFGSNGHLGGWFLVGETVSPLDSVARSILAGEVSQTLFEEIRSDLISSDGVPEETAAAEDSGSSTGTIVRTVIIVLVVLLIVVGLLVWLRRDLSDNAGVKRRERVTAPTGDEVKVLERPQRRFRREEKTNEDSDD